MAGFADSFVALCAKTEIVFLLCALLENELAMAIYRKPETKKRRPKAEELSQNSMTAFAD